MLESGSDIDAELAAIKAQLLGFAPQLPDSDSSKPRFSCAAIDVKLEELKQQLDQL